MQSVISAVAASEEEWAPVMDLARQYGFAV